MWQSLYGKIVLEITCADSVSLINTLNNERIRLQDVTYRSDLVLYVTVFNYDFKRLSAVAEKFGASVKVTNKSGIYWRLSAIVKRPVLLVLICMLLIVFSYLPGRILFISVEGNATVPDNRILEAASECGIRFGTSRRQVRSEIVKNELLQKVTQLQWAGINTNGCTAVISVREKAPQSANDKKTSQISSIVASRDGVIQNCTVYQGNPLCTVGEAVKAGQTLVSGYIDCGIVTKTTQANAEIEALTFRDLEVVTPISTASRRTIRNKKTNYSLRVGKKLIKFYKDSGNLHATCGKIYSEEYVQLPGGFALPIAIVKETLIQYEESQETQTSADMESWLTDFTETYLQNTMIGGQVISAQTEVNAMDDVCYLYGKYTCIEMIGQVRYEQMIGNGDEND